MRRPSVLFINRVYPPGRGASGRVLRDLARSFSREGWQVYVLTTGPKAIKERDGAIKVMRIKADGKPKRDIMYLWIWWKLLVSSFKLPKTDLVVTMTDPPMTSLIGRIIAARRRTKHIHWCQDLYPDLLEALDVKLPGFVSRFLSKVSRRTMQKADKNIVIGRCMAKHLSHTGLSPQKITVIPNWPDHELGGDAHLYHEDDISIPYIEGSKSYDELLKDDQKFRVLYAGNLGRAHPFASIIGAAELLAHSNPEIEFVFVGEGEGFDKIAKERSKRGLENIRLLPYQPNSRLRDIMQSGDLHLISMKHEAAGYLVPCKLYSALAVSRPCIFVGPYATETAKVLQDFSAGQVVPQGDVRALADAILHYRNNGEDWFAAHEGAAKAGQVFVPAESIDAWIRRAEDVIGYVQKKAG